MDLSVLDLFVLSMLDRGAKSAYELQRKAGISLGASTPCLRKLLQNQLVTQKKDRSPTNHKRFVYELTALGKEKARAGWKSWLAHEDAISDLDSILRVADMAAHYGAEPSQIKAFLKHAAKAKLLTADQPRTAIRDLPGSAKPIYGRMRGRCDDARLRAEAAALFEIADDIQRPPGVARG